MTEDGSLARGLVVGAAMGAVLWALIILVCLLGMRIVGGP